MPLFTNKLSLHKSISKAYYFLSFSLRFSFLFRRAVSFSCTFFFRFDSNSFVNFNDIVEPSSQQQPSFQQYDSDMFSYIPQIDIRDRRLTYTYIDNTTYLNINFHIGFYVFIIYIYIYIYNCNYIYRCCIY